MAANIFGVTHQNIHLQWALTLRNEQNDAFMSSTEEAMGSTKKSLILWYLPKE